ncbi:MAG: hypothetical protein PWQ79_618 [Thermococcaceae archaeon]|nr:hypothetical protein [Thermococcaceae archaeon]
MRRRGFLFTLDALLALLLVAMFVTSIAAITEGNVHSTYMRSQSKYTAEDVLMMLRTVPLNQIVSGDVIKDWVDNETLDPLLVSPEMSPLDIVATYWATEPIFPEKHLKDKAVYIMRYILDMALKGYHYELIINNYTVPYLGRKGANYSSAFDVSSATLVLSGYKYNQTPRGYMARAYLTKATIEREDLYGWFRVLAGADYANGVPLNRLNITRVISLPADATPLSADGKFVSRQGEYVEVYINGNRVGGSYDQVNLNNLENYLRGGDNVISLIFSNAQGDEIGSASGTTLYVDYRSSSLSVEDPGTVKIYDVTSERTGIMYLLETFVPGNITSINMRFSVHNVGTVRLYYGLGGNLNLLLTKTGNPNGDAVVEFTDSEIKAALNAIGVAYDDLSRMVFDFVVGFDAYYENGDWYYEGDDNYNDDANRERRIYGYPESYVKIDYVPRILTTQYSIPLSVYFPYGDSRVTYNGNGLQVRYSLPKLNNFEIRMTDGDSRVRDGETRGIIKYFIDGYVGYGDIFPFLLQGYPQYKGYNLTYYYSGDTNSRTILIGEHPYKAISVDELDPTKYAVDDAILRLFDRLNYEDDQNSNSWRNPPYDGSRDNPIDVDLHRSINIDFASMGNIPGLFEPIEITLRIWRED